MVTGQRSLRAAWLWGQAHWERISTPLGFGATLDCPRYTTVWTILAGLDEPEVARAVQAWVESTVGHPLLLSADGKTLRGSLRRRANLPGVQVVSVAAPELATVLTQRTVVNGDALGALLELLHEVRLDGHLLTVDAGLISTEVVEVVAHQGGQVAAPIKGNDPFGA